MAKTKREPFVIRTTQCTTGENETIMFEATPREAARKAVRESRGTFDRTKRLFEQPEGAHGSCVATLQDPATDSILMHCRPSIFGTRGKSAKSTIANCEIKPWFRKRLVRKRRRR